MVGKKFFYLLAIFLLFLISCEEKKRKSNNFHYKNYKENLMNVNKSLLIIDEEKIEKFIERRNWKMKTTKTGLFYQILKKTKNKKVKNKDIINLKYKIYLLNGELCYDSDSTGLKIFRVGHSDLEAGLTEGVLLLNYGEKARFIMPPHLAHGLIGDEKKIKARTTIIYEIEIINF